MDAESFTKCHHCFNATQTTNFHDFILREFCLSVDWLNEVPPFHTFICVIFLIGSEPKVRWIYATGNIAVMKDVQTVWNIPFVQEP